MRAIRDEAFKKNPELEKEIRSGRFGQSLAQEPKIDTSILDNDEESWLKETRAWVESTFGKDESISGKERSKEDVDQHASLQEMNPVSSTKASLSDEESYQKIMKDAEMWEARLEVDRLLKQYEHSHSSTDKIEKDGIKKSLDREMDF